jgi:hypothetical protein
LILFTFSGELLKFGEEDERVGGDSMSPDLGVCPGWLDAAAENRVHHKVTVFASTVVADL